MFSGKNTIFPGNTRKIMCRRGPFWKDHLFRTSGKRKYGFPCSDVKDFDTVILIHNLIEHSNNYAIPSGSLWKYCRDERDDDIADSKLFKYKI